MGIIGFNGTPKTVPAATAGPIGHPDGEIPAGGLANLFIKTTGANNSLTSAIESVRVKLDGTAWSDAIAAHWRALIEALAPANTIPPAARLRFTIPMSLPLSMGVCGIPFGKKVTTEVVYTAGSSAGTQTIGWETLDTQPNYVPRFYSKDSNVGANASPGRVNIDTSGALLYGIVFPLVGATGILEARVVVDGEQVFQADQEILLESQFLRNPQSVVTALFVRMPKIKPLIGQCFIELRTGAGAAGTDKYSFLELYQFAQPQAA